MPVLAERAGGSEAREVAGVLPVFLGDVRLEDRDVDLGVFHPDEEGTVDAVDLQSGTGTAEDHSQSGCFLGTCSVLVHAELDLLQRLFDVPRSAVQRAVLRIDQPLQIRFLIELDHRDDHPVDLLSGTHGLLAQLLDGLDQLELAAGIGSHADEDRLVALGAELDDRFLAALDPQDLEPLGGEGRVADVTDVQLRLVAALRPLDEDVVDGDGPELGGVVPPRVEPDVEAVLGQDGVDLLGRALGPALEAGHVLDGLGVAAVPLEQSALLPVRGLPVEGADELAGCLEGSDEGGQTEAGGHDSSCCWMYGTTKGHKALCINNTL